MTDRPTKISPTPPALPSSVVDGRGIPCAPAPTPSMPPLRDAEPVPTRPVPLDDAAKAR